MRLHHKRSTLEYPERSVKDNIASFKVDVLGAWQESVNTSNRYIDGFAAAR